MQQAPPRKTLRWLPGPAPRSPAPPRDCGFSRRPRPSLSPAPEAPLPKASPALPLGPAPSRSPAPGRQRPRPVARFRFTLSGRRRFQPAPPQQKAAEFPAGPAPSRRPRPTIRPRPFPQAPSHREATPPRQSRRAPWSPQQATPIAKPRPPTARPRPPPGPAPSHGPQRPGPAEVRVGRARAASGSHGGREGGRQRLAGPGRPVAETRSGRPQR